MKRRHKTRTDAGQNHVLADTRAEQVWGLLRADPARLEAMQQETWDNRARLFGPHPPEAR